MKRKWMNEAAFQPAFLSGAMLCSMAKDGGSDDGSADEIKALKAKNAELLDEVKGIKSQLRDAKAETDEKTAAEKKAADELAKKAGDIEALEKSWQEKLDAAEMGRMEAESKFEDAMLKNQLGAALDKAGVSPAMKDIVTTSLKANTEFDIGDDGSVTVGGKGLADHITEWAGTDEGKAFIVSDSNGGGAPGAKNQSGGGGGKTITRSAFDGMDPAQQAEYATSGGTVTDG